MYTDTYKLDLDDFRETFEKFLSGMVSLDQILTTVGRCLDDDIDSAQAIRGDFDLALSSGRLSRKIHRQLILEIDTAMFEEVPTEWSLDTVRQPVRERQAKPPRAPGRRNTPFGENALPESNNELRTGDLGKGAILRDRYVVVARANSGSMGEIFKALDRRREAAGAEDPWVAIKVVSEPFSRFPEASRALQQEAALCEGLAHPNIIRVYDFEHHGDNFFISMEWLDGDSLAKTLDTHRFQRISAKRAETIIKGIGRGLAYAHEQGVIHADVKPGNIFVTHEGCPKLLDFGIARASRTASAFDPSVIDAHTPAYSSCEVLEGAVPTIQDDVYALACVVYRILSGRRVFGRSNAIEAERDGREPGRIGRLKPHQWEAMRRALAFRREDRGVDVGSFIDELFRPEPASIAVEASEPAVEMSRPLLTPGALGATGGAAIIAILAGWFWPRDHGPGIPENEPLAVIAAADYGEHRTNSSRVPAPGPEPNAEPNPELMVSRSETDPPQDVSLINTSPDSDVPADPESVASMPVVAAPMVGAIERPVETVAASGKQVADPTPDQSQIATRDAGASADSRVSEPETPAPDPGPSRHDDVLPDVQPLARESVRDRPAPEVPLSEVPVSDALGSEPMGLEPELIPISSLDFMRFVNPMPPRRSAVDRRSGWVEVQFRVNTDGQTHGIEVIDSQPTGYFENAAIAAVHEWRFKPVIVGATPIEIRSKVRLRFDLD